ncbi:MAG: succinate dehydrogenase cytochrome b subunit [Candidatus Cyclobacteriaceae bacterium M2_1C_046]
MSWFTNALSNSLGKKIIMALTGLFLFIFLITHLTGNLQLLANDGGMGFNKYAYFMTTNPLIKTISFLLYASFLIHIIWSILLTRQNRKARPVSYAKSAPLARSWASRNMGILGTVILIFLIIHLKNFWYVMHFGPIDPVKYEGFEYKNLYLVTVNVFQELWYVILYVVAMVFLGFHLFHGFKSMFQTLGVNHPKYNPLINFIGTAYAILVPAAFAAIPVIIYFKNI